MQLAQFVNGKLNLSGISVPEGATKIDLGISRIRFDEKNPPQITDGMILRASLYKGRLAAEKAGDKHRIGLLIQGAECSETRNTEFSPHLNDVSFLGTIETEEIQFHAMNGSSRCFKVKSQSGIAVVTYRNGEVSVG